MDMLHNFFSVAPPHRDSQCDIITRNATNALMLCLQYKLY